MMYDTEVKELSEYIGIMLDHVARLEELQEKHPQVGKDSPYARMMNAEKLGKGISDECQEFGKKLREFTCGRRVMERLVRFAVVYRGQRAETKVEGRHICHRLDHDTGQYYLEVDMHRQIKEDKEDATT